MCSLETPQQSTIPPFFAPSCSEFIARDIHFISTKRHLEREKTRKGERQICKHLVITRVMLRTDLMSRLLGEGIKPQEQIMPRAMENVPPVTLSPALGPRVVGPSFAEGT